MNINICVASASVEGEQIATFTRELLRDIRVDADPHARLVGGAPDAEAKGDVGLLGQIALALVTGGAVAQFIAAMFGFLGRHRKLEIEVQNSAGKALKLKWDFIDREGEKKALTVVEAFLKEK